MSTSRIHYPLTLAAAVGLLGLAAPVASAAPADQDRYQTTNLQFNCNGDFVELSGLSHVVTKTQQDGSTLYHASLNATGTGVPSGTDYVLNITAEDTYTGTGFTSSERDRLISKGGEQNLLTTWTFDGTTLTITPKCVG